jgi:hypothetical protein
MSTPPAISGLVFSRNARSGSLLFVMAATLAVPGWAGRHPRRVIAGRGGVARLAITLASSGKKTLLLERGDFLPGEMDSWNPKPVFVDGKYIIHDTWCDADGKPFQPQVHYYAAAARRELQGPRAGQPVRGGHQLLPEHRGGEPGAYRDGERRPRGRASHRTVGVTAPGL